MDTSFLVNKKKQGYIISFSERFNSIPKHLEASDQVAALSIADIIDEISEAKELLTKLVGRVSKLYSLSSFPDRSETMQVRFFK